MVVYLVCFSNLCCFSLKRASKIFVISSDYLLIPAQQVHDPPCLGLSSKKGETKQRKPYKKNTWVTPCLLHTAFGG